ncbi:MAG: alpha/beta hydrolase-fold protein [Phycisphaerae bacterium]|nr:hypothetical protein [Phycisphaerales bacterium]
MFERRFQFVSALLLSGLCFGDSAVGAVTVVDLGGDQFMAQFTFEAPADAKQVFVAGTFNQWNPTAMPMHGPDANGRFNLDVPLPHGRYEYKFVVDGSEWFTDAGNPLRFGPNENSVLLLGLRTDDTRDDAAMRNAMAMPGIMELPSGLKKLIADRQKDCATSLSKLDVWSHLQDMPYFSDDTVTFVAKPPHGQRARLFIDAADSRFGYDLAPLTETSDVHQCMLFGVTLDRTGLPKDATYVFEFFEDNQMRRVVDPNAWSVTSRNGRPVGRIIEPSTNVGRIELVENLADPQNRIRPRDIYIYLPPGYDANGSERYPVVYMHDGQNCWDDPKEPFGHGGWSINTIGDDLIGNGTLKPFIAVGIANTQDRLKDYGPGSNIFSADAQPYLQFIAQAVKPLIDKKYNTQPEPEHTSLMGSSMGGAISFQGALVMPDVFGSAACLSTAFMFKDSSEKGYTELVQQRGKQPIRLYLDSGTGGKHQDGAPATRAMVELLIKTGWKPGVDLAHYEDEGADHNERAWRARVDRPLRFLFAND